MGQPLQTIHGLMDIELPAAPPESSAHAIIFSLLLVIFIITLTTIAIRHFNSYRSQARRHLQQLQNRVKLHDTDAVAHRDTVYQLARILSQGLRLNGITSSTHLPAELDQYRERWQLFINNLSTSRFSNHPGETANLKQLFDDAFFWLKSWP